MPPPRLFLDANVLFTAALSPEGRSAGLVKLAKVGKCALLTSPHALAEARRNLELKSPGALTRFEGEVLPRVDLTSEAGTETVRIGTERGLPLKDAPILGAAVQAGADYLVTGDTRHFRHLFGEQIGGVTVLTPADALEALL